MISLFPSLSWALPQEKRSNITACSLSSSGLSGTAETHEGQTRIRLLACGGAAIAIAGQIDKAKYGIDRIIAVDTSSKAIRSANHADQSILLKQVGTRKPKSMVGVQKLAIAQREEIAAAMAGAHMVIVLAGFGGAAGTGISSMIPYFADQEPHLTAILIQPFGFETKRQLLSGQVLPVLAKSYDNTLCLSNDVAAKMAGPDAFVEEALVQTKIAVEYYLGSIGEQLMQPGLVGVDFEDYRCALGYHGEQCYSCIGWGQGSGEHRVVQALEQALAHPLLQLPSTAVASNLVVSIRGSRDMKIREVSTVMNRIRAVTTDSALCIFAAGFDDQLVDAVEVSLIMSYPVI